MAPVRGFAGFIAALTALLALGGVELGQKAAAMLRFAGTCLDFGTAETIDIRGVGAECSVAFGRCVGIEPRAAMTPIRALAAAPFHLPERIGEDPAMGQAGTIDAEALHHPPELLRRTGMGAHQARHVARRDAAVGERALELALLLEPRELVPQPCALAPAFDDAAEPMGEARGKRGLVGRLEITGHTHGVPLV